VYRQFYNYDGVIFLYCHISDSNYRLSIDIETFWFGFVHFRWTKFYRPYSVSDFSVSVTNRIKTYTSENGEMGFSIVFTLNHGYRDGDGQVGPWPKAFSAPISLLTGLHRSTLKSSSQELDVATGTSAVPVS
jgi:hypothetical protein